MKRINLQRLVIAIAVTIVASGSALSGELLHGHGPTSGNVCKLVCETKKLTAVGYGYECDTICIPHPGRRGSKHCDTTCCLGDELEGCPPRIEFCWYDWFACGCAKPRTVKVLTKYQAEREIAWYHWEVVDAECCDCTAENGKSPETPDVYKPAPAGAEVGDVFPLSQEELTELASVLGGEGPTPVRVTEQTATSDIEHSAPAQPVAASVAAKVLDVFRKK
jgi:hypothetical protein